MYIYMYIYAHACMLQTRDLGPLPQEAGVRHALDAGDAACNFRQAAL